MRTSKRIHERGGGSLAGEGGGALGLTRMSEQTRCEADVRSLWDTRTGEFRDERCPRDALFVITRSFSGVTSNVCAGCVSFYRDLEEAGMATIRALHKAKTP